MINENKIRNGVFCAAISLILIVVSTVGVASVGKAQIEKSDVAELTEFANAVDGDISAFKVGLAYLGEKVGLDLGATPGGDFYNPVEFHDSVVGNGSINIELNWGQATTTGDTDTIVLGKYKHTEADPLVCSGSGNDTFIYVDGLVPYTATYRMGTTTEDTFGSLVATNTQTLITGTEIATSTSLSVTYGNILNADDEEGDATRETFLVSTNDVVAVSFDWATSPMAATSTLPETAARGFTASGYAKVNCSKAK